MPGGEPGAERAARPSRAGRSGWCRRGGRRRRERRATSPLSMPPTVRSTLRTRSLRRTGSPRSRPGAASSMRRWSRTSSRWCSLRRGCGGSPGAGRLTVEEGGRGRGGAPSSARPRAGAGAGRCGRPAPRRGGTQCRHPLAHVLGDEEHEVRSRARGCPANLRRSSGSWVAIPTGQVLRWQTRIITQPEAIRGAVLKPNSSAPSMRRDDDVAPGLELAVDLEHDPAAQAPGRRAPAGSRRGRAPRGRRRA